MITYQTTKPKNISSWMTDCLKKKIIPHSYKTQFFRARAMKTFKATKCKQKRFVSMVGT